MSMGHVLDKEELKLCPFCGGEAKIRESYSDRYDTYFTFAKCLDCGAQSRPLSTRTYDEDDVIKVWNRRIEERE